MTRREASSEKGSRGLRKQLSAFIHQITRSPLSAIHLPLGKRLLIVTFSYILGEVGLWFLFPRVHNGATMFLPIVSACWLFRYRGLLVSLVLNGIAFQLTYYSLLRGMLPDQAFVEGGIIGFGTSLGLGLVVCWLRTAVDLMHTARTHEPGQIAQKVSKRASLPQDNMNELKDPFPLHESLEVHTSVEGETLRDERVGQQFGNYRVVHLLGKGGFAKVYLGEHLYLEKHLAAIKVLRPELPYKYKADFLKEAQRLLELKHPHIVSFIDFGVKEDTPFLIMQYTSHGTMRTRHPKGSCVPIETVVSYVNQIASALQYIHKQKLIHRDIKPENMLLGDNEELLLSDFGIMVVAHTTGSLNEQGFAGTVAYMAPEQIQKRPRQASDQYALGVTVYEWLCGTHPFEKVEGPPFADLNLKMQYHHLQTAPPTLRDQLSTIPSAVESVVLKALAKDPKERWDSIQTFATALSHASRQKSVPSLRPVSLLPLEQPASPRERAFSTDYAASEGDPPSTK